MINNEILSFIKEQTASGSTKDQVKDMLVTQGGWDEKDVDEAFETINFSGTSYPSVLKNAAADAVKSDEREAKTGGAFAPASQLMQAVSGGNAHPAVFSPGMSHIEQPKSMEPTLSASSLPSDIMSRPRMAAPAASVEAPRVAPATAGNNAFNAMNANPLAGVPGTGFAGGQAPVFQPVIKEPATSASFPKPSGVAPAVYQPAPAANPLSFPGGGVASQRPQEPIHPPGVAQSVLSSFPGKVAAPVMTPAVAPMSSMQFAQSPQPMAFPKSSIGGMVGTPHGTPSPAQLAVLRAQKPKGGRFLFGLVMLLVGITLGSVSMNAYMKGYINTESASGLVEKVMDMIGLGTPAPSPSEEESAEAPAPPVDEGS